VAEDHAGEFSTDGAYDAAEFGFCHVSFTSFRG
jgi:hypothetical protein